jgi:phosphatidylglycerol:prolipoprotein diacylglycerol transferase
MYGIIILGAIIICLLIAEHNLRPTQRNFLWKSAFYMLLAGVAGARLYHVIHLHNFYFSHPSEIIKIWNGGLGIFGAIVGALIAFYIIGVVEKKKHNNFSFLAWTDIFAFFGPLAQSIGRIANLFNNELLPYAIYESILSLILFIFFGIYSTFAKNKIFRGFYSGAYLIGYGIIRLLIEQYRVQQWQVGQIFVAHIFSILFIITGTSVILFSRKIYGKNSKVY